MWGYLLLFYVFFKANSNLSRTVRTYGGSAATLLTLVLYVWAVLVLHRRSTARSCALSDSLLTWMHVSLHFGTLVWVMQMIFSARYGSQQEHDCYGYMRQRGFRDDVEHVVPPQWEAPVIPLDEPGRIRYFKVPARLQADGTMSIAGYKAKADVHFSQQRIVNDLEPTKCVALCRDLSLACCLLSMLTSHSPLALSLSLTLSHTLLRRHDILARGTKVLVLAFFALDCVWTVVGFVQLGRGAAAHCAAQTPTLFWLMGTILGAHATITVALLLGVGVMTALGLKSIAAPKI